MPTFRNLTTTMGVLLSAALLVIGSTIAGSASQATHGAAHNAGAPNPDAPRGGAVAGLQTGAHLSVNNPASLHAFRVLHRQMRLGRARTNGVDTLHEYVGTSFQDLAGFKGAQATQSVSTKIQVGDGGTTLYMPTMYPNRSCIEVTTAYFFGSQAVAAWDWCVAIRFVAQVNIDKHFMQKYTENKNYSTQIVQTNKTTNQWTAYLYNYTTAAWDTLFTQSGTDQVGLAEGWDLYELYSNVKPSGQSYACADLKGKRVESQDIQVKVGSAWEAADATNAGDDYDVPLSAFACKSLDYQMLTPFSHWKATG